MNTKTLLYKAYGEWYLEPLKEWSKPHVFRTAALARKWAKLNGLTVRRVPNCDSK